MGYEIAMKLEKHSGAEKRLHQLKTLQDLPMK